MSDLRERLARGQIERAAMEARLGCVPLSILRLRRGELSRRMFVLQAEKPGGSIRQTSATLDTNRSERRRKKAAELQAAGRNALSGLGAEKGSRKSVSVMAAELVAFFLRYYAEDGAVYVDPFMGHGIRMQTAKHLGYHYYGQDVCAEYVRYIQAVRAKIDDGHTTIAISQGDSRDMSAIPNGIGDVCFTSPPYWDVEFYGPEAEQLGTGHTYDEFLVGLEDVARELRRKMKPGAYAAINVNDFRRDGRLYLYHVDTARVFERAGWTPHDVWVVDGLVGGLPRAFAVRSNRLRIAPKVHEYVLVFRA